MAGRGDPGFRWLVRRANKDPFFLGWALAEYQAMNGIDDQRLAKLLQCTPKALARLALCRRPDDQSVRFQEDVQRIAVFASCSAERLARLLREVAAVASLRKVSSETALEGVLMAARDRRSRSRPQRKTPAGKREPKE
jgi:hypothetical protein